MVKPLLMKTNYSDYSFELARRGDSTEENFYHGDYVVYRVYAGREVYVYSSTREREHLVKQSVEKTLNLNTETSAFLEAFYTGGFSAGREMSVEEARELVEIAYRELQAHGLNGEVVLVSHHTRVEHVVEDYGARASEERWVHELYLYPYVLYMGRLVVASKLIASNDPKYILEAVGNTVENLAKKVELQVRARNLSPVSAGKWTTLLLGDSACALYHEVAHLLQADEPVKLPIDTEVKEGLSIVEDPYYPGPLQRVFDDEMYPAWRRTLVDSGVVVDYLRTRLTSGDSKPGNARGLFTKPKPLYHQLVVKPGDWRVDEVLEEFKRLIVVEDVVKAELYGGYVDVIPEHALLCENTECKPIRGFTLRIPFTKLSNTIVGLTRSTSARYSYERSEPVFEVTPSTIVNSRVIV